MDNVVRSAQFSSISAKIYQYTKNIFVAGLAGRTDHESARLDMLVDYFRLTCAPMTYFMFECDESEQVYVNQLIQFTSFKLLFYSPMNTQKLSISFPFLPVVLCFHTASFPRYSELLFKNRKLCLPSFVLRQLRICQDFAKTQAWVTTIKANYYRVRRR